MTKETVRIDYIIRPEKLETPGMIEYVHYAEPIVCREGDTSITDLKKMTVEVVRDGDD